MWKQCVTSLQVPELLYQEVFEQPRSPQNVVRESSQNVPNAGLGIVVICQDMCNILYTYQYI